MINLLLADDHQIIRDGLKALLTLSDNAVEVVAEAANGKEVMDQLTLKPVDIVLMDINMPEMDGLEVTEYITAHFPNVKVLILSMVENKHLIAKAFQAGAKGYLLKSAGQDELIHAISAVSRGETYVTTKITFTLFESQPNNAFPPSPAAAESAPKEYNQVMLEGGIQLSKREIEVLHLIAKGYTNAKIADQLFTSKRTVENHRQSLLIKTGCTNTAMLIHYAAIHHLLE